MYLATLHNPTVELNSYVVCNYIFWRKLLQIVHLHFVHLHYKILEIQVEIENYNKNLTQLELDTENANLQIKELNLRDEFEKSTTERSVSFCIP